jgi:hypothetical protein
MDRSNRQIVMLSAAIASVLAVSFTAVGYASSSINYQEVLDNDYLEPCGETCTASEEDYENLTTFELFALYPELEDELEDETSTADEATGESDGPATNQTSTVMPPQSTNNQTSSTNSTRNFTG